MSAEDSKLSNLSQLYGQRLREVREKLSEESEKKVTQESIAEETGLTQNIMYRLEKGDGRFPALAAVLSYYYAKGVNLNWIFAPDNRDESFFRLNEDDAIQGLEELQTSIQSQFKHVISLIQNLKASSKKGT